DLGMLRAVLAGLLAAVLPSLAVADPDSADKTGPTQRAPSREQIDRILNSGLLSQFTDPHPLAFGQGELKQMGEKAKEAHSQLRTELGDPSKEYDLVIQPGHFGRTRGATGGEGKFVTEQQIAAKVVD